jgi:sugar lactone lactonase YvrE
MLETSARGVFALVLALAASGRAGAAPVLANPAQGSIALVAQDANELDEIDGLAFDAFGNLFGALEIDDIGGVPQGGVVYVNKSSGAVTNLISDIDRADQIAYDPANSTTATGVFYVTSESRDPPSTIDRVFRVEVAYAAGVPIAATRASVTTSDPLLGLEGLVVLETDDLGYGDAGDLFVSEDPRVTDFPAPHAVAKITPTGTTTILTPNGDPANDLERPEGMAFGDFGGALSPALYAATTTTNRVVRIDSDGTVTTFGAPGAVGLDSPDNLEFGPDGLLYVGEDRGAGRIIRIAADGTHSVFATGFNSVQGLAFDPTGGDLYISEQAEQSIWRITFAASALAIPEPSTLALIAPGLLVLAPRRRSQRTVSRHK